MLKISQFSEKTTSFNSEDLQQSYSKARLEAGVIKSKIFNLVINPAQACLTINDLRQEDNRICIPDFCPLFQRSKLIKIILSA